MGLYKQYWTLVVVVTVCLSRALTVQGQDCPGDGHYQIPRFGAICQYRCRCTDEAQCDKYTGSCWNGCARGWMGPGCQYRNIAPLSYQTDQSVGPRTTLNSYFAIDGETSTCTNTYGEDNNAAWWRIEFPVKHYIVGFIITVPEWLKGSNVGFRIEGSDEPTFAASTLCFDQSGTLVMTKLEVMCQQALSTKHIRIVQTATSRTMEMCEVEIYGGRYVSYKANTWQNDFFPPWNSGSFRAVDGRPMLPGDRQEEDAAQTCSSTEMNYNVKWNISFTTELVVQGVDVYGRRLIQDPDRISQITNFKAFVVLPSRGAELIYDDNPAVADSDAYQPKAIELAQPKLGIGVEILKDPTRSDRLSLCEVEVFAECSPGWCGWSCADVCQCSTVTTGAARRDGRCPYGCKPWWKGQGDRCDTACSNSTWGKGCTNLCHCVNGERCHFTTGRCANGCAPGWKTTATCNTPCDAYTYGAGCSKTCGHCKNGDICDAATGRCPDQCKPGWKGGRCQTPCEDQSWGHGCNMSCGGCRDFTACNKATGVCESGCLAGLLPPMCTEACPEGTYGQDCVSRCGYCKDNATCDHINGHCPGAVCEPGWRGAICKGPCEDFTYGQECNKTCGQCLSLLSCNKTTGICPDGCTAGFRGSLCTEPCVNFTYGANCLSKCGNCRNMTSCNINTGYCPTGCEPGMYEPYCTAQRISGPDSTDGSPQMTGVIAGLVGAVLAIAVVVIIALFLVRRRKSQRSSSEETIKEKSFDAVTPEEVSTVVVERPTSVSEEVTEPDTREDNVYVNAGAVSEPIAVSNLRQYCLHMRQDPAPLFQDFADLPQGRCFDTKDALKGENKSKNRYRELYPYDKNRVFLPTTPDSPSSDYINASFIDGYESQKRYIAAQGAMKSTVADIWRMIWSHDIAIIVMLTGCYEHGRHKCEQYWPDGDTDSYTYDDIEVTSKLEDVYSDHTTRTFEIKKKNCTEKRMVSQYHFTGWPDKDVPDDTLSLVRFWRMVKQSRESDKYPWVVHCSAGIGRTGTFIALDYLFDQGKTEQSVDVKRCAHHLRNQRVNMVQTKEQYMFVHQAVFEALNPVGDTCSTETFLEVWKSLQKAGGPADGDRIFTEYQQLSDDVQVFTEGSDYATFNSFLREEDFGDSKTPENIHKSRSTNVLPPDRYRPRLSFPVDDGNDYINAVFISTFRMKDGLIMSQIPLETTVVDNLRLIWQYKINTVVLMKQHIQEESRWWPDTEDSSKISGPFTIWVLSEEVKDGMVVRRIRIKAEKGEEERELMQFHYQGWSETSPVPESNSSILGLISEVDAWYRKSDSSAPILVQCLYGVIRSGLFGVIWSVLERIKSERTVAIAEAVRLMRVRRKQIISNCEQYRYCWAAVAEYLDAVEVYGNVM